MSNATSSTTTTTCPSWCVGDHPDADQIGLVHQSASTIVRTIEVRVTSAPAFGDLPAEAPSVWVGEAALSAAEARELAAALVRAAEIVDREP